MGAGNTVSFSDPDGYAAGFGDAFLKLTITGAGAFRAQLSCLKLQQMEVYRCYENLPRIAYVLLSSRAHRPVIPNRYCASHI